MNIIIEEIVKVLQTAPARFAKVFFSADIHVKTDNTLYIKISTTFDYYGKYEVALPQPGNPWWETIPEGYDPIIEEKNMEKFHQTGLALGTLEYYLNSQNLEYTKTFQYVNNEVIAEYNIACLT